VKGIQNCSCKGQPSSPRGDNSEIVKIHLRYLKLFLSRTKRLISMKLGTNLPEVKGILNCSNKGPGPFQRVDNNCKNGKRGWAHLKIFFSRTTRPEKLKFT
jgi:hypothetical protein